MSEQVFKLVLWIAGGMVSLLMFFVSFYFYRSVKAYDDLSVSVNKLQYTLTGLNAIILSIQDKNDIFTISYKEECDHVDKELHQHNERLVVHGKKITRLEALQEK